MTHSQKQLRAIYDRTTGYCHICHKKLAFKNYGIIGSKGEWEIEHSNPQAKGGTNRLNNLYPACIQCNRSKGKKSNKVVRVQHGVTRAPLSKQKRKKAKIGNAIINGIFGGAAVGSICGPVGAILEGLFGAKLGYDKNPDKD